MLQKADPFGMIGFFKRILAVEKFGVVYSPS